MGVIISGSWDVININNTDQRTKDGTFWGPSFEVNDGTVSISYRKYTFFYYQGRIIRYFDGILIQSI